MKRWFFGLMLVLSAVFAIIPMPSVVQTPQTRRMRHPGLAKSSRICRYLAGCSIRRRGTSRLITRVSECRLATASSTERSIPYQPAVTGAEKGKLRQARGALSRNEMLASRRAAYHLHAAPVSDRAANRQSDYSFTSIRITVRNVWMNGNSASRRTNRLVDGDSRGS